jgi:2',3'-cyclic-nucleotide 2'-phosphodiesterase (5'-nucleotidase family)
MILKNLSISATALLLALISSGQSKQPKNDGKIEVVFLQLNDIYEISPLDHGRTGGVARLATIRKELLKHNPSVYTVLAGDFLSPSAMGTILYDTAARKKIAGMQMVESLGAAGVNLVTFGNHEFDISPNELTTPINQSSFDWISSNVKIKDPAGAKPFTKTVNHKQEPVPATKIISFRDKDGTRVNIGLFALTIKTEETDPQKPRYEMYEDYFAAAQKAIEELRGKCHFIIAVTHLSIRTDKELARRFPEIKLIIGGHEHINSYDTVGHTIIAKADANVRSVYIHELNYEVKTKALRVKSRLLVVNNAIEEDSNTKQIVDKWNNQSYNLLHNQGFEPCRIIDSLAEPLDGREVTVRTEQTNLCQFIGESMREALAETSDCSLFNGGTIRLDDMLAGYITEYDIFRVLPFENKIVIKNMQGYFIDSLLKTNYKREKDGSFLQYSGITQSDTSYLINGKNLYHDTTWYKVAMNFYLAAGFQPGLDIIGKYGPPANTSPQLIISTNDMKNALIEMFRRKNKTTGKVWPGNNAKIPCY